MMTDDDLPGMEEGESDPMAMAMLDLLSCGIGGAILLFIIFAVVTPFSSAPPRSEPFLMAKFRSTSQDVQFEPIILWAPPERTLPGLGDWTTISFQQSTLLPGGIAEPPPSGLNGVAKDLRLFGFSRYGLAERRSGGGQGERSFIIQVFGPKPGHWRFGMRFRQTDTQLTRSGKARCDSFTVKGELISPDGWEDGTALLGCPTLASSTCLNICSFTCSPATGLKAQDGSVIMLKPLPFRVDDAE